MIDLLRLKQRILPVVVPGHVALHVTCNKALDPIFLTHVTHE
jgi:hypothetical protein